MSWRQVCWYTLTGKQLTVVQSDDVQAVEQLALVLVDPLHLHIKHGAGVDLHLVLLLQVCSELQLVLLEGGAETCREMSKRMNVECCIKKKKQLVLILKLNL